MTTKYNTWTNTFTKHSKCYKMGCIGPIVLQFGYLYKLSRLRCHHFHFCTILQCQGETVRAILKGYPTSKCS